MQKIDLHVVSIPDHEAQVEIARLIVAGDHTISMQTAIEMAKDPPILLFHNMDVMDAKEYVNTFERLGVAFKVSMEEPVEETKDAPPEPAMENHGHREPDDSHEPASAKRDHQVSTDSPTSTNNHNGDSIMNDSPKSANAGQNHQASGDSQASTGNHRGDRPPDDPRSPISADHGAAPQPDDDMREFAGIKAHNETIDRGAEPTPPHNDHADQTERHGHTAHPLHTPLYAAASTGHAHDHAHGNAHDHTHGSAHDHAHGNAHDHAHGSAHASGLRVGDIGLDELAKIEKASSKKSLLITIISVGVLLLLGVAVTILPKNNKFSVTKTTAIVAKKDKKNAAKPAKAAPAAAAPSTRHNDDGPRDRISSQQKQRASAYVDSAKASAGNAENSIAFYKVAVSFNRYNLPAWQGLLQAYRETGRETEANETLRQMTEIFGDEVMSISALVKPFGDLMDAYMSSDGTYRIEYRTRKLAKDDVQREVFNMTRAVRSACSCKNISIYASTGTGRGMLAHSSQETSVHTMSAFSKHAEIIWLD